MYVYVGVGVGVGVGGSLQRVVRAIMRRSIYTRTLSVHPDPSSSPSLCTHVITFSNAPKGNGIGATGSRNPVHIRTLVFSDRHG